MSGFCVLGVSRQKLETIVSRRVAALERRLKCPPRPGSTERRTRKVLAAIQANPPREIVSHEFSAPQFCCDFIELATRHEFQFLAVARKGDRPNGERPWVLYED